MILEGKSAPDSGRRSLSPDVKFATGRADGDGMCRSPLLVSRVRAYARTRKSGLSRPQVVFRLPYKERRFVAEFLHTRVFVCAPTCMGRENETQR